MNDNENRLIAYTANILLDLLRNGFHVTLTWISRHSGVPGDEMADAAAKRALTHFADDYTGTALFDAIKSTLKPRFHDIIGCGAEKTVEHFLFHCQQYNYLTTRILLRGATAADPQLSILSKAEFSLGCEFCTWNQTLFSLKTTAQSRMLEPISSYVMQQL